MKKGIKPNKINKDVILKNVIYKNYAVFLRKRLGKKRTIGKVKIGTAQRTSHLQNQSGGGKLFNT